MAVRRLNPRRAMEAIDQGFWQIPAIGMLIGIALGFVIPVLDDSFDGAVGPFAISDFASARSLLETIATVTVSVAGLSFSVTVVAVQLASQQLSPRVLRTFQRDRLNKVTLALFLGTFSYALIVLARLGADRGQPNLSMTVGVVLTVSAFGLFAAFIHNIIGSLQASTVIRRIGDDARGLIASPFPDRLGAAADDQAARATVAQIGGTADGEPLASDRSGYLTAVNETVIEAADADDGLVVQCFPLGGFAVTGTILATVRTRNDQTAPLVEKVREGFELGGERTLVEDVAFPIRQLADIALRALSPSLNDPTTAENAMGTLADALIRFVTAEPVQPVRCDPHGVPRFVALVPGLDDLVRLGFEQVGAAARDRPVTASRLSDLLDAIERAADEAGHPTEEIGRQRERLADPGGRNGSPS